MDMQEKKIKTNTQINFRYGLRDSFISKFYIGKDSVIIM